MTPQLLDTYPSVPMCDNVKRTNQDPHPPANPYLSTTLRDGAVLMLFNSGFKSTLTSLISAGLSKHSKTELSITTDSASTLTLDNTQGWFKEAMHLPSTRSWIEQRIDEGDNIYMIVGFTCINNAYISYEACRETATEGQGQLPIAAALAATGAVVPLVGDILDPSIGASLQALDGAQSKFLVPGEQVCALQICKISHSWFSSKRVDTSRLSKPWWSSVERWRDEDDGEDDIIEVELSQVEDLDEKWAKVVSGDEVFFRPLFEEP
ncbi:hypothetical protein TruAng_006972 [Truncatella angustata]|nr:hypothetical protein TruAng_006972 [Truncatella angustata]